MPSVYSVTANVQHGNCTPASPDGRYAREPLSDCLGPVHTQCCSHDHSGPTAIANSVAKIDQSRIANGVILNWKFSPAAVSGDVGRDILIGLMLSVGGVVMLKNAALSGATLAVLITMVVGLGWMLEGVMALVESWRMPSSAWAVIYALLSIVAGFIVLFSPISSTTWLILFGGCALVAIGIVAIVRAFTFGKSKRK